MVFSSRVFLFAFLPLVLAVHFVLPARARNAWLLFVSLFFYAWGEQEVVLVMIGSIAVNYGAGLYIGRHGRGLRAKVAVAVVVVVNLAILVGFKYLNFLADNLNAMTRSLGGGEFSLAQIALPIGISFFTFQAMSYVVDVYRGAAPVQKSPVSFAMYIALFPQLVAGPIVRYREIAEQIASRTIDLDGFARGIRRFVIGLSKKMLLANTAAIAADKVFAIPAAELTTATAWTGVIAYTAQIYFDFSGYSDMAIGLGLMLGFRFPENFNFPYIARSITEFWRRWHMSLSNWFRDYLYIPLGGNRAGHYRTYFNLVLVFLLCGFWHGAEWTFIVWGAYHGAFLVFERIGLSRVVDRLPRVGRHVYAMLVVMVGWVLFRADTVGYALEMLKAMIGGASGDPRLHPVLSIVTNDVKVALLVGAVAALPILPWLMERIDTVRKRAVENRRSLAGFEFGLQCASLFAILSLFLLSAVHLAASTHNPFIYFRF